MNIYLSNEELEILIFEARQSMENLSIMDPYWEELKDISDKLEELRLSQKA